MDKAKRSTSDNRQRLLYPATVSLALWLSACGGGDDSGNSTTPQATEDWQRDILLTSLTIDLDAMQGSADILLAGSTTSSGASFEAGDLIIAQVTANG
ncbi:MAG: hypothetical protein JAY64_19530, partial [Candidatus Thiodiazotropha weberae]|nr:hypothetical protein [Candidatus Thiodiazotropha lotti]MCW4213350.1 hypothetical protein [Candidatus Thiodiazotropha lotti]